MTGRSVEGVRVPFSVHKLELQSFHTATAQREAATWLWLHSKLGKVRPAGDGLITANSQTCPPEKGLELAF